MILTLCVDGETGKYLAISAENPPKMAVSYTGEAEALGMLVARNPSIDVRQVLHIDHRDLSATELVP